MLRFQQQSGLYVIVRLAPDCAVPDWASGGEFVSVTRTADELSIVCLVERVPEKFVSGPRWFCLKLQGPFPFSQTGVLLSFIEPLSKSGIPIFAISTYDTDYVLVPQDFGERALAVLKTAGHERIGA